MTMIMNLDELPLQVTKALANKAKQEGKSVLDVAGDAIARGLGVAANTQTVKAKLDLSDIVGTWVDDPEFDEAMKDFETINPELWK